MAHPMPEMSEMPEKAPTPMTESVVRAAVAPTSLPSRVRQFYALTKPRVVHLIEIGRAHV